jgi:hypothetical protein
MHIVSAYAMGADRSRLEVFALSNTGVVRLNPTWGTDICVCVFVLCLCCPVGSSALQRADPPPRSA